MKFQIGQQVKSLSNEDNLYTVEREVDRQNIEVRHLDSAGGDDLVFTCRKNAVVPV